MRRRRSTVSVGVLLLHLQQCLTFQTHHDIGSRVRPRNGAPTIIASSAVTDKVSPSPEETELRLDPEAIQLKDDLIALASATRRGVSRRLMCTSRVSESSSCVPNHVDTNNRHN